MDIGAGLASFAFWGFIAAIVVAGVWDGAKKRDAQHETLRRLIESGKPVDETLMKRLMIGERKRPDRDLGIGAIILFSIAVGLGVIAMAVSGESGKPLMPLLGAAGLVACLAAGLWAASIYARRARDDDDARPSHSPGAS